MTNLRFVVALAVAALGSTALPVQAQSTYFSENNKTIKTLGVQGTLYYVNFVEPHGQNCIYGQVYITSDRKEIYTHLLAAMLAGIRVSRIDYSQSGGNGTVCYAELVEISP